MEKETALERISSSPATALAAAATAAAAPVVIGSLTATLLAPLLPVLVSLPATLRNRQRVEHALNEINEDLLRMEADLQNLTDGQFDFISQTLLTILSTASEEKIEMLKTAIKNGVRQPLGHSEGEWLSRILRAITVEEARFLVNSIRYKVIHINFDPKDADRLRVRSDSPEHLIANGLASLGILAISPVHYLDVTSYVFSPIAHKLVGLVSGRVSNTHE